MKQTVIVFDPNDAHVEKLPFHALILDKQKSTTRIFLPRIALTRLELEEMCSPLARTNLEWIKKNRELVTLFYNPGNGSADFFAACLANVGENCEVFIFTATTTAFAIRKRLIPRQGSVFRTLSYIKPAVYHRTICNKPRPFYKVVQEPRYRETLEFRTGYRASGDSYVYPIRSRTVLSSEIEEDWTQF